AACLPAIQGRLGAGAARRPARPELDPAAQRDIRNAELPRGGRDASPPLLLDEGKDLLAFGLGIPLAGIALFAGGLVHVDSFRWDAIPGSGRRKRLFPTTTRKLSVPEDSTSSEKL